MHLAGLSLEGLGTAEAQRQAATQFPRLYWPLPGLPKLWFGISVRNKPSSPLSWSCFLDVLWSLLGPLSLATLFQVCITYETVPCRALGMVLRYVDGRVFVIEVLPESQAEVDEVVLAGDILNEINGCSLRNAYSGQAGAVLQKLKGQPLSFHLLRWQWHNGEVYEPLLPYLKILKEKEPHFQLQHNPRHRAEGEPRRLQGAGCSTTCDTWDG
ncbi:uncharacterized protein LOC115599324 isoform X2 [Calypte anna]|uniref:uncharacterized protein LOC115599324 isoform X2 n=1 Tax=Calypte anna TaxID=9244 RepID=UPI0011C3697F|nr:uncharacterized protein LOC115599324 isoform X2 [Calypte anna]